RSSSPNETFYGARTPSGLTRSAVTSPTFASEPSTATQRPNSAWAAPNWPARLEPGDSSSALNRSGKVGTATSWKPSPPRATSPKPSTSTASCARPCANNSGSRPAQPPEPSTTDSCKRQAERSVLINHPATRRVAQDGPPHNHPTSQPARDQRVRGSSPGRTERRSTRAARVGADRGGFGAPRHDAAHRTTR